MKHALIIAVTTGLLGMAGAPSLVAADPAEETQLIQVLQSNASPQQKDAACSRLKQVGTARSVPALAAILPDPQLSHSARLALESMPAPEADQALIDALVVAQGPERAGVITSLGVRRTPKAVPALARSLADADPEIAVAAAAALGKFAQPEAAGALLTALPSVQGIVRDAVQDGLLQQGNRWLDQGEAALAGDVFRKLLATHPKDFVRMAAFRGLVLASDRQQAMVIDAIQGTDGPAQIAALELARSLPGAEATMALAGWLAKVPAPVQVALIEALGQRGDPAAAPAVLEVARSPEAAVRQAALTALGRLGDATAVPVLLAAAQSTNAAEQKAAREALLVLSRGNVTEALLSQLKVAGGGQTEVLRALGGRADTAAVPKLLELAAGGDEATQVASLRALAVLADAGQTATLTRLVVEAKHESTRSEAKEALAAICQRAGGQPGGLNVAPIVQGVSGQGDALGRIALLQVCSGLVHPKIRAALRAAAQDPAPAIREAAIRALCDSRDPAVLPDLLAVARDATPPNLRVLALRGYVRLATDEETARVVGKSPIQLLQQVRSLAVRPEEKRILLAGLATVADPQALELVTPLLPEAEVKEEAAQAVLQIAQAIGGAHPVETKAALHRVLEATSSPAFRDRAVKLLRQMEAESEFLTAWQVAGPYRENGKDYAALFDREFAPETAPASVPWRPMPVGTDPQRPWVLDLLKLFGGEQCVAYLRTSVHAETEQPAVLELGSDDGVKVWLNGKLVYANNTARPLTVGSDKAQVTLRAGWNSLRLKITQNNLGWECCARLVKPDGARLEGLRVDAARSE